MHATASPHTSMDAIRKPSSSNSFNSNPDGSVSSSGSSRRQNRSRSPSMLHSGPAPKRPSGDLGPQVIRDRDSSHPISAYSNGRDSTTIRMPLPAQAPRSAGRASFAPHALYDDNGAIRPPSPLTTNGRYPSFQQKVVRDSRWQPQVPRMVVNGRSLEPEYSYIDMDIEERMQIRPTANNPQSQSPVDGDSEFARRPPEAMLNNSRRLSPPRKTRFRRFLSACARPFRALTRASSSVLASLKTMVGRKSHFIDEKRPVTAASSGWDFRDPTPAPPSIRQSFIQNENEARREPVTIVEYETVGNRPSSEGNPTTNTESTGSHPSPSRRRRTPSPHRSQDEHEIHIPNEHGNNPPLTATTQTHPLSPGVRSSVAIAPPLTPNSNSHSHAHLPRRRSHMPRGREGPRSSSWTQSTCTTLSQGVTSLVQLFERAKKNVICLYNLPWIAAPTKPVAIDFIPALQSGRSQYRVYRPKRRPGSHRTIRLPPTDLAAANEAEKMEPAEGRSWYRPSTQQIIKRREQIADFEERGIKPKRSYAHRDFNAGHRFHTHTYEVPCMCSLDLEQFGHSHAQHHPSHIAYGTHPHHPYPSPHSFPYAAHIHSSPGYLPPLPPGHMPQPMHPVASGPPPPGLAYAGSLKMPVPSMPQRNISLRSRPDDSEPPHDERSHSSRGSHRERRTPMPLTSRPGPYPSQAVDPALIAHDNHDLRYFMPQPQPGYMYSSSSSGQPHHPKGAHPPSSWITMPQP